MNAAVLAVIFDFDDTLAPDSTTKLLRDHNVDTEDFWRQATTLVQKEQYDPALAWLKLFLDRVGPDRPLGKLTNQQLGAFSATLDGDYFKGIPQLFDDLRQEVKRFKDISIEFYIISGGLKPVLLGSKVVRDHFTGVYATELAEDPDVGYLRHIKRCITFTEKTRYIFEINKGIEQEQATKSPNLVNQYVKIPNRRVPFENMIYVGDGLTDIPCFSLVGEKQGRPFAVFNPDKKDKAKQAFREFLSGRKLPTHFPRYTEDDELGLHIRNAVVTRCGDIKLASAEAEIRPG